MSTDPYPLSSLIRQRMAELNLTYGEVAKRAQQRGHKVSRTLIHGVVNYPAKKQSVRPATLKALAAGLDYPLPALMRAAGEQMGIPAQVDIYDVPVPLKSAASMQVIVAATEPLTPDEQAVLARKVELLSREMIEAREADRQG